METELLTRQEAAEYLKVKRRTLDVWAVQGYGPPFFRVGRLARYRRADIDAWLDSQIEEFG